MKKKLFILFLFSFLSSASHLYINAQQSILNSMIHLSYKDGLSNSAVLSITQDSNGFIWLGTYDGLNYYDSSNIRVFRNNPNTKKKLLNNIIEKVHYAGKDELWLEYSNGIQLFSTTSFTVKKTFDHFNHPPHIYSNSNKETFILSGNELFYYDYKKEELKKTASIAYSFNKKYPFLDSSGILHIIPNNGVKEHLYKFTQNKKHLFQHKLQEIHSHRIKMYYYQQGLLYFIDQKYDLYIKDLEKKTQIYICNTQKIIDLYGPIENICLFKNDILIAFQENGLMKLDASKKYELKEINKNLRIFCMFKDTKQDIVWIGTDGHGAYLYFEKESLAQNIMLNDLSNRLTRQVRSIYTDSLNTLWFGTKGDGLISIPKYTSYKRNNQNTSIYFPYKKIQVSNYKREKNVFQIFTINKSKYRPILWLGTASQGGLAYYNYNKDRIDTLIHDNINLGRIHKIIEIKKNVLLVASDSKGIIKIYYKQQANLLKIDSIKNINFTDKKKRIREFYAMIQINDSLLYIGSRGDGLIQYNICTHKYKIFSFESDINKSANDILSLHLKNDTLYIGTVSGFLSFKKKLFRHFEVKDLGKGKFLLNNMIHGILEDKNGFLWLSTNRGIIKYNTKSKTFHSYYYTNGIKIGEFSDDAYFSDNHNNNLLFGGINGLLYLSPQKDKKEKITPHIFLKDLKIEHKPVEIYNYYQAEKKDIFFIANELTFSLRAIVPDYLSNQELDFSYRLLPNQANWKSFSLGQRLHFTDIKSGKYELEIRYKKDVFDGDYTTTSNQIIIQSPWYSSKLAWICYFFITFFIIGYLLKILYKYLKQKKRIDELLEKEELMQKELTENSKKTTIHIQGMKELDEQFICENNKQKDLIAQIIKIIDTNIDNENLGSSLLASEMAMSTRQFYRKFKEISDESPSSFIKNYRLQKAAHLLVTTDLSIQDIVLAVGLSNRTYFYKSFTEHYAKSPKKYRELNKK